jgi:F-type H+-transporting ATPase subunit delta
MSIETVARRYATALADVVIASKEADAVQAELAIFGQLIAANENLATAFSNPAIAHANKENLLAELLKRAKPSKTTSNFLRVLLQNGRLGDINEINTRFAAVLDERRGIVAAEVVSARELPDAERKEFEKTLEKLTGKDMQITFVVDPEIIGGAVTRIGSNVYDGSVKTKLENLKAELIGA